jgi:hypothetical protein
MILCDPGEHIPLLPGCALNTIGKRRQQIISTTA